VIEAYKAKKGFYPPSNTNDPSKSPLYYELLGSEYLPATAEYETLNKSAKIKRTAVAANYGVSDFVNATLNRQDPDAVPAQSFHQTVKESQITEESPGVWYYTVPVANPNNDPVTRWKYNSYNPTHNPEGFDLWVDVIVGGNTNTIGN